MASLNQPKRALVLALGDFSSDPRPNRHARLLETEGFTVDVLGFPPRENFSLNGEYFFIKPFSNSHLRRFAYLLAGTGKIDFLESRWFHRQLLLALGFPKSRHYDLVLAEDLRLLRFAVDSKLSTSVLFDAREFYPEQLPNTAVYRWLRLNYAARLCSDYLKVCTRVISVSRGISDLYFRTFGVESLVIRSTPEFRQGLDFRPVGPCVRLVYHGRVNKMRNLETIIHAAGRLAGKYSLDLYLTGGRKSINNLRRICSEYTNVRVNEPVAFQKIQETLQKFDAGLSFFPFGTQNLRNVLPNKFFEYIHAGLAVIASPSRDQAEVLEQFGCGFVTRGTELNDLETLLRGLKPADFDEAKERSIDAARVLCFQNESIAFREILSEIRHAK